MQKVNSSCTDSRSLRMMYCEHSTQYSVLVVLVFLIFFLYVPCAKLSWPSPRLLSAGKCTVSYRIVSCKNSTDLVRRASLCDSWAYLFRAVVIAVERLDGARWPGDSDDYDECNLLFLSRAPESLNRGFSARFLCLCQPSRRVYRPN